VGRAGGWVRRHGCMLCYCPARGGGSRTGESWLQLLRSSSTVCNGLLVRKFIASLSLRHIAHTRTPRRTSGRRPSGHKLSIVTRDDERVLTRMLRVDTQARPAPLARLHARGTPLHSFFEVGGWSYRTRTRWQATHWRVHASRGQHCSRPPGRPKRRTGTTAKWRCDPPPPSQGAPLVNAGFTLFLSLVHSTGRVGFRRSSSPSPRRRISMTRCV
jgi:hypothetical protein